MKFKVYEFNIPDFYLPYLINGNRSGLKEDELTAVNKFLDKECNDPISHFSTSDDGPFFMTYHDLRPYGILACNCERVFYVVMEA